MSAHLAHARRPVVIAVMVASVSLLPAAASQAFISAAPYKDASDTGIVTNTELLKGDQSGYTKCSDSSQSTCTYANPDACVVTDPYSNLSTTFQQWNVPYCDRMDSGWVLLSGLEEGWAITCPSDAPMNWSASGWGQISAIQLWSTGKDEVSYLQRGPDLSDRRASFYVWNESISQQYFRMFVACSGDGGDPDKSWHNGGKYCCGNGPGGTEAGQSRSFSDLVSESRRPHTPRWVTRRSRDVSIVAFEFHPRARSRGTRSFSCPSGTVRRDANHAVSFMTVETPSPRHAKRDVRVTARKVGRRSYSVTTAINKIKKREVRLQVSLTCVRAR